jgi:7-keto-8-aminopelargonate synthetase-like enzyme
MEDEKTKQEPKQEKEQEEAKPSMVESAHKVAEELRAENARMEQNIAKLQELKAFETLGGQSEGRPQETKPVEISDEDYAMKALRGDIEQQA